MEVFKGGQQSIRDHFEVKKESLDTGKQSDAVASQGDVKVVPIIDLNGTRSASRDFGRFHLL